MTDPLENAWRLLDSTSEWVRFADAKAAVTLAGAGVLGGILAQVASRDGSSNGSAIAVWATVIAAVLTLASGALALAALLPRLTVGEPISLVYFDHVGKRYKKDQDGHAKAMNDLTKDDEALHRELVGQIWANSVVARRKYLWSGWSLFILGVAGALAATAVTAAIIGG